MSWLVIVGLLGLAAVAAAAGEGEEDGGETATAGGQELAFRTS